MGQGGEGIRCQSGLSSLIGLRLYTLSHKRQARRVKLSGMIACHSRHALRFQEAAVTIRASRIDSFQQAYTRRTAMAATACALAIATLAGCASGPAAPEIVPSDSTVQLGRIVSKTFLTQVNEETQPRGGGVGVGLGGFGGSGGGGVGVGLGFDLGRIFGGAPPTRQIDIYAFKVRTLDGPEVTINSPALPGLETGSCVRVISANRPDYPRMSPSRECP